MNENYYHILGLDNYASVNEVRVAYRKLAKKYHPDRNPGKPDYEEKFKRISIAYKLLTNPAQKALFDERLKLKNQPTPQKPQKYTGSHPYYDTKKREYTPKAKMYGKIFIIAFIMAIILIPLTLLYQSSVRYYERGLEAYQKGNLQDALLNYNRAMTRFGGRYVEAGTRSAEIYLYNYGDYEKAWVSITKAIEFAESDEQLAYLYFLRGISNFGLHKAEASQKDYLKADSLNYNQDSLRLKLGFLYAFEMADYERGENNFQHLIDHEMKLETAWFGKAWCLQQTSQYHEAIESFNKVIGLNNSSALAYFYRANCHLQLSDTVQACTDFKLAGQLGYKRGNQHFQFYCAQDTIE